MAKLLLESGSAHLLEDGSFLLYQADELVQTTFTDADSFGTAVVVGSAVALDGLLTEWTSLFRLDTVPSGVTDYALYGWYSGGAYNFALVSPSGVAIGPNTTFWLNTDLNTATGYQVFGWAVGAEFNIGIAGDGKPYLYSGSAGEVLVSALAYAFNGDSTVLEVRVPETLIGSPLALSVYVDVNDSVFLPNDYSLYVYQVLRAPPATCVQTTFDDADTFGTGLAAPGAVTCVQTTFDDADAFGTGAVTFSAQTCVQTLFADADDFGTGLAAPGAVTCVQTTFDDADAFGTGTAAPAAVTCVQTIFADADAFGTGHVSITTTLNQTIFVDVDAFGASVATAGALVCLQTILLDPDLFGLSEATGLPRIPPVWVTSATGTHVSWTVVTASLSANPTPWTPPRAPSAAPVTWTDIVAP